ncbi:hypothetical protein [Streptosporangium oxazolinicum]
MLVTDWETLWIRAGGGSDGYPAGLGKRQVARPVLVAARPASL